MPQKRCAEQDPVDGNQSFEVLLHTHYHDLPNLSNESPAVSVDPMAIGMRRLSIIDLAGGSQPIYNEDRTIRTVYNGEIYNFRELRRELESRRHVFSTNTDTEVIVHAYEEYGEDFPKYFNGMFAFALHDTAKRKLYLVRDHLGIKPLYYAFGKDYLIWGSEIKAILASGIVEKSLDLNALSELKHESYKNEVVFEILGSGPEKEIIRDYIKNSAMQGLAEVKDGLPRDELMKKIKEVDIIILPSLTDINPNFVIEALMLNKHKLVRSDM